MDSITPDQAIQLGLKHHMAGQLAEAEAVYRRVLAQQPNNANALHLLGTIAAQTGQSAAGLNLIDQAIAINPNQADFHNNKGLILAALGSFDAAIAAHSRAIALRPDFAEAHNNLGNNLLKKGRPADAVAAYRKTIAIRPDYANAYVNLGVALHAQGKFDEAIAAYQSALTYQPNHPEGHSNMGVVLRDQGRLPEAIAAYRAAIALRPDYADAHANLGAILEETGMSDESFASFEKAISLNPDHAISHFHKAVALLRKGDFKQGWQEYEWRAGSRIPPNPFPQPRWDGRDLAGKTILLYTEQGYGDAIQFSRYVPLVADRGAKVLLLCHKELQPLLQAVAGVEQVFTQGQQLPNFDLHCPLSSLPLIFDTHLENIPANIPYLSADSALVEHWRPQIQSGDGRLTVGLIWDNTPANKTPRPGAILLDQLAPLAKVDGVRLISLQGGQAVRQMDAVPGMELRRLTADPRDFADAAAVIANVDLLVTVDTAVAHLAGAIGKPVWLLLPFLADWRWLLDRSDSPWYPTARLFRQPAQGDWNDPISRLADALAADPVSIRQPSGIVKP